MTVQEFFDCYYMHDSSIEWLEYDNDTLKLYCIFCDFLQSDYQEGDYSNSDIIITFYHASFEADLSLLNDAEFLSQKVDGNKVSFFMESSGHLFTELHITADSVDVTKIRFYSL